MRRRIFALPVAFALAAIPGALTAQACVGSPIGESFNGVSAQVGFPQDAMSYGASVRHNRNGPLTMSAGYSLSSYDNVDPKQHGVAADVSYELSALDLPFSACPTVGASYSRISDDAVSVSALSIPIGVGIGHRFALSPAVAVIPHVVPQWVWTQVTIDPTSGDAITGDDSMLAALVGATFSTSRFYFGGGLTWVDQDDTDPVFSIMAGMPF